MIREFVISVDSINMQLKKYQRSDQNNLGEEYGVVVIPNTYYTHNGKSMGIMVVHPPTGAYHAADMRCSHCFYDNEVAYSKIQMIGGMTARCPVCGADVDSFPICGSVHMKRYDNGMEGPVHLDIYLFEELKVKRKKYLLITNSMNGLRDEWLKQPENQKLLERGRPYQHPIRELNKPKFEYPQ